MGDGKAAAGRDTRRRGLFKRVQGQSQGACGSNQKCVEPRYKHITIYAPGHASTKQDERTLHVHAHVHVHVHVHVTYELDKLLVHCTLVAEGG